MHDHVEELLKTAKATFDLTEPAHQERLYALTRALLEIPNLPLRSLQELDRKGDTPLEFKIAVKLVQSRRFLLRNTQPVKIGITFSMWGEQHRLRPQSPENPHGEDALRIKLDQLAWATQGTQVAWKLYPVDGGCPHGSGEIAEEIAARHSFGQHVAVLYLDKILPTRYPPLSALQSADESRKGGEIIAGCLRAMQDGAEAVIYTDADNSVHLGQIGLLLEQFMTAGAHIVIGNRKDADSVFVKQEDRSGTGIKLFRHIQRMILQTIIARGVRDTQAPFKLYDCSILQQILPRATDFGFSFDTDWLLIALALEQEFESIPFAFIDSAADSSFLSDRLENMTAMLRGIMHQVKYHGIPHNEEMARVIDEELRNPADVSIIMNALPPKLRDGKEQDLGNPTLMSPAEIRTWIRANRA